MMKISVITATFNSGQTIRNTIESVLAQTYKDIEYIVVDGNSSDETLKKSSANMPLHSKES